MNKNLLYKFAIQFLISNLDEEMLEELNKVLQSNSTIEEMESMLEDVLGYLDEKDIK